MGRLGRVHPYARVLPWDLACAYHLFSAPGKQNVPGIDSSEQSLVGWILPQEVARRTSWHSYGEHRVGWGGSSLCVADACRFAPDCLAGRSEAGFRRRVGTRRLELWGGSPPNRGSTGAVRRAARRSKALKSARGTAG